MKAKTLATPVLLLALAAPDAGHAAPVCSVTVCADADLGLSPDWCAFAGGVLRCRAIATLAATGSSLVDVEGNGLPGRVEGSLSITDCTWRLTTAGGERRGRCVPSPKTSRARAAWPGIGSPSASVVIRLSSRPFEVTLPRYSCFQMSVTARGESAAVTGAGPAGIDRVAAGSVVARGLGICVD